MIGMLLKDFFVLKSLLRSYLLILGIFAACALTGVYSPAFFATMCVVLIMMLPGNSFAYDEQAGWDKYAAATPEGRRGVVRSKYLFSLAIWGAALALSIVICIIVNAISPKPGRLADSVLALGVGMLMLEIILPLLFKFGAQKSRIMFMVVVGAAAGGGVALATALGDGGAAGASLLGVLFPIIALGGLAISYFTSLSIYQKKEL